MGFGLELFGMALGASMLGGMLGMASGVFIVPLLTLLAHVDMRTAIGASLVSVIACSCGAAAPFLKARLTNIRLAIVLETATTVGALTGISLSGFLPTSALFATFAAVLAVSAWQMMSRRHDPPGIAPGDVVKPGRLRLATSYPDPSLGREVGYQVERLPLGMGLMYCAGLLSALLGIGSGVLKIPAMDTALRLPIKVSSATSSFMIGVTAAASALAYLVRGDIVSSVVGPVVLGSVLGAALGGRILIRVPVARLRILFVGVLVVLAVQMLLAAFGLTPTQVGG